jgi:hypothetical protein
MEAMRQSWSDDRLDDLNHRVDAGFARVDQRFTQMEARMDTRFAQMDERMDARFARFEAKLDATAHELRMQVQGDTHQLNSRFDAMQQTMIRIGGGLIGVLVASSAGLIATQL